MREGEDADFYVEDCRRVWFYQYILSLLEIYASYP